MLGKLEQRAGPVKVVFLADPMIVAVGQTLERLEHRPGPAEVVPLADQAIVVVGQRMRDQSLPF